MIALVNYGLGNILAFANIYKRLNIEVNIASSPDVLQRADRIILPGVGSFDWAMTRLNQSGLRDVLEDSAIRRGVPVLGVCVGMQILARRSDEGKLPGLGWVEGEVRKFDVTRFTHKTHLPHMGWNDVTPLKGDGLFKNLHSGSRFYFLHSYYFLPSSTEHVLAETDYNGSYASAVRSGNVFGVQFHPEKSHKWGIQLLKNFAEL